MELNGLLKLQSKKFKNSSKCNKFQSNRFGCKTNSVLFIDRNGDRLIGRGSIARKWGGYTDIDNTQLGDE